MKTFHYIHFFLLLASTCIAQEVPDKAPAVDYVKVDVPAQAPAYSLVRLQAIGGGTHHDVLVFTTDGKGVRFVEVNALRANGWYVFTGPPGKYSIRVSAYSTDFGFLYTTASMEIVGDSKPVPVEPRPEPETPPVPVEPGNPSTGPPPEAYTGLGPLTYYALVKARPDAKAVKLLAKNFEWAANDKTLTTASTLIAELKKRNDPVFASEPKLKEFYDAWRESINRQIENGVITSDVEEHRRAYAETLAGIHAAYGK